MLPFGPRDSMPDSRPSHTCPCRAAATGAAGKAGLSPDPRSRISLPLPPLGWQRVSRSLPLENPQACPLSVPHHTPCPVCFDLLKTQRKTTSETPLCALGLRTQAETRGLLLAMLKKHLGSFPRAQVPTMGQSNLNYLRAGVMLMDDIFFK